MGAPHKRFMAISAVSSFVPDAVLSELLAGDRLVGRYAQVRAALVDEMVWLESVGKFFLAPLSFDHRGQVWRHALRGECIAAAHVSASYIQRKTLSAVESYPWKLGIGNISSNLPSLEASAETIPDTFASSVRVLLRSGFNRKQIQDVIELKAEAPWSTTAVEQAHGSLAVVHKFHRLYGADQLAKRAMVHQARHYFTVSDDERRIRKHRERLDRMRCARGGANSARQYFLGVLMREMRGELPEGARMSASLRQDVMRRHADLCAALTPAQVGAYAALAEQVTAQRRSGLESDIQHQPDALS